MTRVKLRKIIRRVMVAQRLVEIRKLPPADADPIEVDIQKFLTKTFTEEGIELATIWIQKWVNKQMEGYEPGKKEEFKKKLKEGLSDIKEETRERYSELLKEEIVKEEERVKEGLEEKKIIKKKAEDLLLDFLEKTFTEKYIKDKKLLDEVTERLEEVLLEKLVDFEIKKEEEKEKIKAEIKEELEKIKKEIKKKHEGFFIIKERKEKFDKTMERVNKIFAEKEAKAFLKLREMVKTALKRQRDLPVPGTWKLRSSFEDLDPEDQEKYVRLTLARAYETVLEKPDLLEELIEKKLEDIDVEIVGKKFKGKEVLEAVEKKKKDEGVKELKDDVKFESIGEEKFKKPIEYKDIKEAIDKLRTPLRWGAIEMRIREEIDEAAEWLSISKWDVILGAGALIEDLLAAVTKKIIEWKPFASAKRIARRYLNKPRFVNIPYYPYRRYGPGTDGEQYFWPGTAMQPRGEIDRLKFPQRFHPNWENIEDYQFDIPDFFRDFMYYDEALGSSWWKGSNKKRQDEMDFLAQIGVSVPLTWKKLGIPRMYVARTDNGYHIGYQGKVNKKPYPRKVAQVLLIDGYKITGSEAKTILDDADKRKVIAVLG